MNKLLQVAVRPNGVLWKNALAAYEKLCERRDWIRQRVAAMVIEETRYEGEEDTFYQLYLLAEQDERETGSDRYLASFTVSGDLDQPADLEIK